MAPLRSNRRNLPDTEPDAPERGALREVPLEELERGLRIDRNDLEGALLSQSDSFYQIAKHVALITSQRDAAKQEIVELEAEVDARVRHDASVAEEKITEKEVESEKKRDPQVRRAMARFLELNHRLSLAAALKDAFVQRSYVLKDLCGLLINQLYSSSDSGRVASRHRTELSDRAREGMATRRLERSRD